jgi:membrane protease YdiL (CAAX protease family)
MNQPDLFMDSTRRMRTFWRFLIFGAGFVAVQVGVSMALGVAVIVYLLVTDSMPAIRSPEQIQSLQTQLEQDWALPLMILSAVPTTLLTTVWVLFCRWQLDRRSVWTLGLSRPGRRPTDSVIGGLMFGLSPLVAGALCLLVLNGYRFLGTSVSIQTALLVPTFIVMAFFEEIVCRGYLLQNMIDLDRPGCGVLFSSVVFWLLHSFNPSAWSSPLIPLNLFGAGVTLALAYRVAGNIWFPTALHFGWNFGQGVVFEMPVSGIRTDGIIDVELTGNAPEWFSGGAFGLEASVVVTVIELGLSVIFLALLRRRSRSSTVLPSSVFIQD